MKFFKNALLLGTLAIIASCNKSDVSQNEEDFSNPQQVSQEYNAREVMESNFDALPSSESISTTSFIPDRVGFNFDSSDISSSQRQILDAQIEFIKQNMNDIRKLRISGYCDERGSIEYNYALGERRANAVKKYYVKKGIPASFIETISYGKEVVLVEGSNEEAYRQNRVGKVTLCNSRDC